MNFPKGKLSGFEFEIRQHLGHFWMALEGLSIQANTTIIDSEVTLSDDEAAPPGPAPLLSEHTESWLTKLGYDRKQIADLRGKRVI